MYPYVDVGNRDCVFTVETLRLSDTLTTVAVTLSFVLLKIIASRKIFFSHDKFYFHSVRKCGKPISKDDIPRIWGSYHTPINEIDSAWRLSAANAA